MTQRYHLKISLLLLGGLLSGGLQGCNHIKSQADETHRALVSETQTIWGRQVSVFPCVGLQKAQTERDKSPLDSAHTIKCLGGSQVRIENETLMVDGKNYGLLPPQVPVTVSHGKVKIDGKVAQPITQVAQK